MTVNVRLVGGGVPLISPNGVGEVVRVDPDGSEHSLGSWSTPFRDYSAPPGLVSYRHGGAVSPRVASAGGGLWLPDGTVIKGFIVDNSDPYDLESGRVLHSLASGGVAVRFPLSPPPHEVEVEMVVDHKDYGLLRRVADAGVAWVRQASVAPGLPPVRLLAVDRVHVQRHWGSTRVLVSGAVLWDSLSSMVAPLSASSGVAGTAGAATYRDAREVGFKFGDGSYLDLVDLVARG